MLLDVALLTVVGVVGGGVEELVLGLVLVVLGMAVVVVKGRVGGITVVFGVVMHVAALCTEFRIVPIEL